MDELETVKSQIEECMSKVRRQHLFTSGLDDDAISEALNHLDEALGYINDRLRSRQDEPNGPDERPAYSHCL